MERGLVVILERGEPLPDDSHGVAINDLIEALRFVVEVFERFGKRRKGVEKIVVSAQGAAGIVGEYKVTAHRWKDVPGVGVITDTHRRSVVKWEVKKLA